VDGVYDADEPMYDELKCDEFVYDADELRPGRLAAWGFLARANGISDDQRWSNAAF
jgi:hypothetical protein